MQREHAILDVDVSAQGVTSRRGFLCRSLAGGLGAAGVFRLGWHDLLVAKADQLRKAGKSMILLWMDGGPSQYDTFNPKPGSKYQGPAHAIHTCIPGVQVAEYWPKTARVMDKIALIRSMKSTEREHDRAIALVRTGYLLSPAVRYPTWGAVVARDRERFEADLPSFVRIGRPRITTRDVDAGVLGVRYNPFKIDEAGSLPPNLAPQVEADVVRRRLALSHHVDPPSPLTPSERNDMSALLVTDNPPAVQLPRVEFLGLELQKADRSAQQLRTCGLRSRAALCAPPRRRKSD